MKGTTLLIMGGNSKMAVATAVAFAREGANIVIIGRRPQRNALASEAVEEIGGQCLALVGDVTDEEQVASAVAAATAEFGGLHWAFNNAGADQPSKRIPDLTREDYELQFDVNVRGTFYGLKHEIPAIIASGGGAICNNASAAAHIGVPTHALYSAAKAAVVSMTRSAALEFARENVRVNVISPASTDSDMFNAFRAQNPQAAAEAAKRYKMGRMGTAEEIAKAVLFLSRDATYTTGHALPVDGGVLT
jgi:NAD(P)-dependent dehydrogenase (short-subunit alcohol dehydrogenase family)